MLAKYCRVRTSYRRKDLMLAEEVEDHKELTGKIVQVIADE
jgi:hypothetical protein